jgi:hypothetical protein
MHKSLSLYAQSCLQMLSFVADRPCINDVFVLLVVYVTSYMRQYSHKMPESLGECFDAKNWKLAVFEADVSSTHACSAGTKLKSPLQTIEVRSFIKTITLC